MREGGAAQHTSAARSFRTCMAQSCCGPVTAGAPGFMIPAFSNAICSMAVRHSAEGGWPVVPQGGGGEGFALQLLVG